MTIKIETIAVTCPGCHNSQSKKLFDTYDHEYHTSDQRFPLNECLTCHLVFLSPRPVISAMDIIYPPDYSNYHTGADEEISYVKRISNHLQSGRIKKLLNNYLPGSHNLRILDVGCGDGHILDRVKEIHPGFKTFGVEPNTSAAKYAAKKHTVFTGMIEDYKTEEKFDVIFSSHVIEHVAGPLQFLVQLNEMLNPEGILVIDTPNIDCLQYRIFKKNWGGIHSPRHWTLFSQETLNSAATKSGLKTLENIQLPMNIFWVWSFHSWLYEKAALRPLADKYFHPVDCIRKRSLYYLVLMCSFELMERLTGFFNLGLGQQRAIFKRLK